MTKPILIDEFEVAAMLGVPRTTVHRLARGEGIEAHVSAPHRIRYRKSDVTKWAKARAKVHGAVTEHVEAAVAAVREATDARLLSNGEQPRVDPVEDLTQARLQMNIQVLETPAIVEPVNDVHLTTDDGVSVTISRPGSLPLEPRDREGRIRGATCDDFGVAAGEAYFQPAGANPGEAATMALDFATGNLALVKSGA